MNVKTTSRGFKVNAHDIKYLQRFLDKMNRRLPDFKEDLVKLELFIRKTTDKYSSKRKSGHTKDYADAKSTPARYEASFVLTMPKKRLVSFVKGTSPGDCIHKGGRNIIKETKKYKDLHFKSFSHYPNHNSIRRGYGI